jgi:hypothetical protein
MEEERFWQGVSRGRGREEGVCAGGEMIRSELIEPESGAGRQLEREIRRLVSACCFRLGLRASPGQVKSGPRSIPGLTPPQLEAPPSPLALN